nr:DUF4167 domain-containing protein [Acidisphaera sp. L21]
MNMKRMRGRNNRGPGGGGGGGGPPRHQSGNVPLNRNHVFDSNGPDIRVRGTAQQLFEKYLQLGRDATSSGDRVMAEGYFQHAEHYFRIINAINQAQQQNQPNPSPNGQPVAPVQAQHNGPRRDEPEEDSDGDDQPDLERELRGEQPESRPIPIAAAPGEE